ncbi:MAG: hypothetical protein QG656_912 [Candidatus Hydrogenedentes bacterium]|nr:hypothetical protein [Candidatus Hydrogenedentota bacterium]
MQGSSVACGEEETSIFSPTVTLTDIRFVYYWNGPLLMELIDRREDLLSTRALSEELDKSLSFDPGIEDLSPAVAQMVFENIPEEPGDVYTLLFPESLTWTREVLTTVAVRYTDGYDGFIGVLGQTSPWAPSLGQMAPKFVALAWKGDTPVPVHVEAAPRRYFGEAKRKELERIFLDTHPDYRGTLKDVVEVFFKYPNKRGVLLDFWKEEGRGERSLFCLMEDAGAWIEVPFEDIYYAEGKGIVLQHNTDEAPAEPQDVNLYVLPDLDRNGASELLFVYDYFYSLCAIEPSNFSPGYVIREVRTENFIVY